MAENRKKVLMCPACFCREKDLSLNYDEEEGVYYCRKCCYEGSEAEIKDFYEAFTSRKYPWKAAPYDGNSENNFGLLPKKS